MPILNQDFDDVTTEYVVVEPGRYDARVESVKEDTVGQNNYEVLKVGVRIKDADDPDHYSYVGEALTATIFLNQTKKIKRLIHAAGMEARNGFDTDDLIGSTVKVRVGHRSFKTKEGEQATQAEVKDFLPVEELGG